MRPSPIRIEYVEFDPMPIDDEVQETDAQLEVLLQAFDAGLSAEQAVVLIKSHATIASIDL
jgi:hypothetical protein